MFPSILDAPDDLFDLACTGGGCGPLAAWRVLRHFNREVSSCEVIRACRFDAEVGTYAVAIAVCLAEHGLLIEFSTEIDPEPNAVERDMYARAEALGVSINPARNLAELAPRLEQGAIAILHFQLDWASPDSHFAPLIAIDGTIAVLPEEADGIDVADLEARRRAPGLFRQCVLALAPPAA